MQRVHIVSAAAAVAVVGFLLMGRGSNTSWVTVAGSPGSAGSDQTGGETTSPESSFGAAQGIERRHTGAPNGGPGAPGVTERSRDGARGKAAGERGVDVVPGQARGHGGTVGDAVGRLSRLEAARGGTMLGATDSGGAPEPARDRANVKEFLADPTNRAAPQGDDAAAAEGEGDVLLSVPLNRDTGVAAEDSTAPIAEQDLEVDDDGVRFEPGSVLAFPNAGNIRGDSGTLQLDVQPEWSGGEEGDFSLVNVRTPNDPRNLLRLFKNGRYLRFMFADASGVERDISAAIDDWDPGEVRTVTATWGEGRTALYVNGRLVGQNNYDGPLEIHPGTPLYLGSDVPEAGAKGAGGVISNFQVFGRALGGDEIASR